MSSATARLAELAAEYDLPAGAASSLAAVLELVAADPRAPTAVRDSDVGADAHIADSLAGLGVGAIRDAGVIADIGAGAGFPGLALAAALPTADVVLLESQRRKCEFLESAIEVAGLANARAVHARAEEWRAGAEACDVVTARAVGSLAVLTEYAAPLLRLGGTLVAWKGARSAVEEQQGAVAAAELGLAPAGIQPVRPVPRGSRAPSVPLLEGGPDARQIPAPPRNGDETPARCEHSTYCRLTGVRRWPESDRNRR